MLPLPRDLEHAHKLVVAHHLVLVAIRHAEPACMARGSVQVRNQAQHRAKAQDQALQADTANNSKHDYVNQQSYLNPDSDYMF